MEVTRRFWAGTASGGLLAALGVAFARPVLVVGAAAVWGLLVGVQLLFLVRLLELDRSLSVEQSADREFVTKGETVEWLLAVRIAESTPLAVSIEPSVPVSLGVQSKPRATLAPGETTTRTSATTTAPVAGTVTIPAPTVDVTGPYGLFAERFDRGPPVEVTVEPKQVDDVHVGEGGDAVVATPGGRHRTGELGTGIDPAEIREYVPGDTVSDIDWKATARLAYPHVREFEVETDRRTVLLFDRRGRLSTGPEGESMLAYLREVALTFVAAARNLDDPLGLYAIGDDGVTAEFPPRSGERTYEQVRTHLLDATPTGAVETSPKKRDAIGPETARQRAATLRDEDSAYARSVRPFVAAADPYVRRIADRPLFATVRTHLSRLEGELWVVLFTDDRDRIEVREAVKLARAGGNHVVVFLTPASLFEPDRLGDLADAYASYRDFEEFRQELTALDRVDAYEIGPGDRVDALLTARRERRDQQ